MLALPPPIARALEQRGRGLTVAAVRLGALGDVLRTVPAVRLLRRGLPEARILWIVEDRYAHALDEHPDLDGVLPVPRKELDGAWRAPTRWPALVVVLARLRTGLRQSAVDVVVDFHCNLRSGVVGLWTGASVRIGYDGHQQKEGNRWLTTHRIPSGDRRTPRSERNLALVRALSLPAHELVPAQLPIAERGRAAARELLAELGLRPRAFAIVAPGASAAQVYKAPPPDLLGAACDTLVAHGVTPLLIHGPGELALAQGAAAASRGGALLAPPTDLGTLAALMRDALLFVGGDSGPLHLACAVGCPALGIYGPTDPVVNQPWGVPFRTAAPPGRAYTGVKRADRAGGFAGLTEAVVVQALRELLEVVGV